MKSKKLTAILMILGIVIIGFTQCTKKKGDSVTAVPATITTPATTAVDTSWTLDQVHVGFVWKCLFMNLDNTYLTGKFNNFGFSPKFSFDPANPSTASIHFWIDISTFNTGQPGRDGKGKCGPSYLGVTYLDSAKTKLDSNSIWAYFDATTVAKSGDGYVAHGVLRLNRWRAVSGHPDGEYVAKQVDLFFTYNEFLDVDGNHDGVNDQYRVGMSGHLAFNRRDFIDVNSTKQWVPIPTVGTTNLSSADVSGNLVAAANTMYGVYNSTSVGDSCWVDVNPVFYKNH
jgi:polyisoprenoid-binding protein YceI